LNADLALGAGRFQLSLDKAEVDLARLAKLLPSIPVKGMISAQGRIEGSESAPRGQITITGRDISAIDDADGPEIELEGRLGFDPSALNVNLTGTGLGPTLFNVLGSVGLAGGAGGPPLPGQNSPLEFKFNWSGDLEPLMAFAPLDEHRLTGAAAIDLRIGGVVAKPDARGTIALGPGRYEHLNIGAVLDFERLEILANGPQIVIQPFTAKAGPGTISGSGSAVLDGAQGFPFQFEAKLLEARLAARDDVTATASGDIRVEGGPNGIAAYARIITDSVEVELVDNLPPSIPTLQVKEIGPLPVGRKSEVKPEASGGGPPVFLDVQVSIPHRFYVRGRGLDSEWQGEVLATGTAAEPIVNGQLNLKRGSFDLLGKPLELTKGVVRLEPNASKEIEAIIDILATYTGSDFAASVQLDGVANNPTLTLSSIPELPRDEILSRLLFGKNAGALTAVEGVQLASAISTISGGGGGGFDPVRAIRQAAGADVLQVDVAAEGGPTVKAGNTSRRTSMSACAKAPRSGKELSWLRSSSSTISPSKVSQSRTAPKNSARD
jgi:translocation and assembly module TamB